MAEHPNVQRLREGYAAFAAGDLEALKEYIAEDVTWHEGGRNQLAGDYQGRDAVYELFGRLIAVTGGSLDLEVRAVFADDEHGVVLAEVSASRDGRTARTLAAHIHRLRDGRTIEFWDGNTDPYAWDELIG